MKRFAIILLAGLALALLALIVVFENTDISSDNPSDSTTEPTLVTTGEVCEHNFLEASFISPRTCEICEATEGEPLCMQCETWEDVVALVGFDEYEYDLQVMGTEDHAILWVTINDANLFATEEAANNFMLQSYLAFTSISWFSQNRLGVTTPEAFQVDASINLNFPDGSIMCLSFPNTLGFTTLLSEKEDSPNKYTIEKAYNQFFGSVKMD